MSNSSDCEDVPIGDSLLRLGISSSMLLAKDGVALTQIPKVTNAVVLDLHYFMSQQPKCTYKSLAEWLADLFGDMWPKDMPPTVKALTLSVKRLLAKRDKLKKLRSSSEKDQKILEFMDEEYILPTIFQVKGKVYKASEIESASSDCSDTCISSRDDSSELETLKSVNEDLSTQLRGLKVENESLKETESHFTVLREKMYSLHRNTKKKIGRRDKQISEQSDRINKHRLDLDKLYKKFSQMESQVKQLRKDKDKLRHRVDYWRTKSHYLKSSSEESDIQEIVEKQQKISTLKDDLQILEENNVELKNQLEEMTSSTDREIETVHKGRFNDDIRSCCYELLSLNVGIRNVDPVIRAVLSLIAHRSVDRLPSHSSLCRMITEGLSVAEMQLGETLTEEGRDNFTLQTDGTTKYGEHYTTFDVATVDGTYTLGLRHVFSGSAQNTLDTLKEILEDLDIVQEKLGRVKVSNIIVSKLKNTMSDRHAAEKLFNDLLSEYRAEILPHVVTGWSEASNTEKELLTRMNNFFCGLHFIVGLAECAEATLKLWEESHELDAGGISSGTQRLVRTACKGFHSRGCQKAGCSSQFRIYLRNKGIDKIPLAAFYGNRFNILFYDAAGVYFLKSHMLLYLTTSHGPLNQLLQAVLCDLKVPQFIAGCRALGIVDKLVTGPLWRYLSLSGTSVLNMSSIYTRMKEKFDKWADDAQYLLDGSDHFIPQHEKSDEVSRVLFMSDDNDTLVQELLQLLFKSFSAIVQRLLGDHLPGGEFFEVEDALVIEETKSVPTTNVNPERDFAALDRLLSQKPNATHIALESLLLYSYNKTSSWLQLKPFEERERLLKAARALTPIQKSKFNERREEIRVKRQAALRKKEEENVRKAERERKLKENLTKKVQSIGFWTNETDIEEGLKKMKTAKMKRDALKLQINFRKKVLLQSHADKSLFLFSHNGKQHSCAQLISNLTSLFTGVLCLTKEAIFANPELLVQKRIDHLFEEDGELKWFKGTVLEYKKETGEYRVVYDNEDSEYNYPLLDDIANDEVIVYSC